MAKDWSHSALDDLYLSGQLKRAVEPRFHGAIAPRREVRLGLAGLSLVAGVCVALVYVWPVLMLSAIVAGGPRGGSFWLALGASCAVAAIVAWMVTTREERYWDANRQNVSDWADPPPWK
jgi:hypothetical protein